MNSPPVQRNISVCFGEKQLNVQNIHRDMVYMRKNIFK